MIFNYTFAYFNLLKYIHLTVGLSYQIIVSILFKIGIIIYRQKLIVSDKMRIFAIWEEKLSHWMNKYHYFVAVI